MSEEKLNKNKSILQLINHLENKFGFDQFIINDFWDADLCAIGISDPQKESLVYISTFSKKEGQYYISIENINNPKVPISITDNIEINELEIMISKHLNLKRFNP